MNNKEFNDLIEKAIDTLINAKDFITIYLTKYNEYGNLETNQIVLSVKELQAINKKCQELGWE